MKEEMRAHAAATRGGADIIACSRGCSFDVNNDSVERKGVTFIFAYSLSPEPHTATKEVPPSWEAPRSAAMYVFLHSGGGGGSSSGGGGGTGSGGGAAGGGSSGGIG
jgi:uncharacterized membrane protein YgcG